MIVVVIFTYGTYLSCSLISVCGLSLVAMEEGAVGCEVVSISDVDGPGGEEERIVVDADILEETVGTFPTTLSLPDGVTEAGLGGTST